MRCEISREKKMDRKLAAIVMYTCISIEYQRVTFTFFLQ